MDTKECKYTTKDGATLTRDHVASLLVSWAESYVGTKEQGWNKGIDVERFQRTVDNSAYGEPWCMAFVQTGVVDLCKSLGISSPLYPTEHCVTLYHKTEKDYRHVEPMNGSIMIQQSYTSDAGHTGFVVQAGEFDHFRTVEGNTNADGGSEGDGVYKKIRNMRGTSTKRVLGFIDVPRMIIDQARKEGI